MKIKTLLTSLLLSSAAVAANAQPSPTIAGVQEYCYPANRTSAPKSYAYLPDGPAYLQMSADGKRIVKFDTATGKELETIFDCTHTRETTIESIEGFSLSPDGSRLLLYRDSEAIYRHSFTATYYVFEIKRNILLPLSTEHPRQQLAVMAPNGLMVAFVSDNNIYLKKLIVYSCRLHGWFLLFSILPDFGKQKTRLKDTESLRRVIKQIMYPRYHSNCIPFGIPLQAPASPMH